MSREYGTLRTETVERHILLVTLDRPEVSNALNTQMGRDLLALWSGLSAAPGEVRAVVLTGAGSRTFCAGADLKERNGMTREQWEAQHEIFERQYWALLDCPMPVIGAANGHAVGGGLEMLLACDFIYAARTARFALTEVTLGIMPGAGGTQFLPRAVGERRAKEIIFVNGQNYYPYDLENIAQHAPGLDLNKVVATNIAGIDSQSEELGVFVLHRGTMQEFLATAAAVGRLINEHTGLEVAQVIPTKRIPKTTSGKVQRHLLVQAHIDGEFDTELAELRTLREARGGMKQRSSSDLESHLQSICETVLPGKRIDIDDNLFEIGASSLKLIEIHENINRDFSGLIDLTELFEHPTIAKLALHLQSKLENSAA